MATHTHTHTERKSHELKGGKKRLLAVAGQDPAHHPKSSPKVYANGMLSSALDRHRHGQPRAQFAHPFLMQMLFRWIQDVSGR